MIYRFILSDVSRIVDVHPLYQHLKPKTELLHAFKNSILCDAVTMICLNEETYQSNLDNFEIHPEHYYRLFTTTEKFKEYESNINDIVCIISRILRNLIIEKELLTQNTSLGVRGSTGLMIVDVEFNTCHPPLLL